MEASGLLSVGECERIRHGIREVQAVDKISDAKMSRALGVSQATFSQVMNGKYVGDTQKYLKEMREWLQNRRDTIRLPDKPFVSTSVARRIIATCEMAADLPCIGMIQTPSGWGKSAALVKVQRSMGRSGAVYISAGETCRLKKDLLLELARCLGVTVENAKLTQEIYNGIRRHLAGRADANRGRSYLIIIDEATTLKPDTINMLRNLHDDETCHPAIILADTVARMDSAFRGRHAILGGNEQILSRAKAKYLITGADEMPREDVEAVAKSRLASLGVKVQLTKNAVAYLHGLAARPGALRNVTSRLETVYYYAARRNVQPDYTVAQMDYIGGIAGEEFQMEHTMNPFDKAASAVPTANPQEK